MRRRVSVLSFTLLVWSAAMSAPTPETITRWRCTISEEHHDNGVLLRALTSRTPIACNFYITVTDKDGKQVEWMLECQPLTPP
jgi:hypothetical protein